MVILLTIVLFFISIIFIIYTNEKYADEIKIIEFDNKILRYISNIFSSYIGLSSIYLYLRDIKNKKKRTIIKIYWMFCVLLPYIFLIMTIIIYFIYNKKNI